jgi:hypothetical protein
LCRGRYHTDRQRGAAWQNTAMCPAGGTIWCARRWDGTGRVLNAASADELAEYLEAASSR